MNRLLTLVLLTTLAVAAPRIHAADIYDTPEKAKADADFAFQGEYVGEAKLDGKPVTVGAQIVAEGKGKFIAHVFKGGLPGDGWKRGDETWSVEGVLKDGAVVFDDAKKGNIATIKDGVITVVKKDGGEAVGTSKRVDRVSPTMGKAAPDGALVLFSGKKEDLANFQPGARIADDGLLMEGVNSKPLKFNDQIIHVEFRLSFMPEARGQGRSNSGVYAQGRYETQVLDSFGLDGADNECGGIYKVGKPIVNMCFPPLTWQTYDIDFTAAKFDATGKKIANARITVVHNGVTVQDNKEIPGPTTAAPNGKESPDPGYLHLQNHGNPVRYRNVWIAEKK